MASESMSIVDIGFNACSHQFKRDLPSVLSRAAAAGITGVLITGVDMKSTQRAKAMCEANQGKMQGVALRFCAGVHPHDAKHFVSSGAKQKIPLFAKNKYCQAVGECGLDFNRDFSPREVQKEAFIEQVKLAVQLQKPLFLHQRDAHDAFLEIMDAHWPGTQHAVVHCFTGSAMEAAAYIDRGFYVGFTGTVCMPKRGKALRAMLSSDPPTIPLDRLLLETDAPFMHPFSQGSVSVPTAEDVDAVVAPPNGGKGGRKRRCEPADIAWVVKTVAACYKVPDADVARQTTENAVRVFGFGLPSTSQEGVRSGAAVAPTGTAAQPAAVAAAAAAGGSSGSCAAGRTWGPAADPTAAALTPRQEQTVHEALLGAFVDAHVHLDEVLSALKISIPGVAAPHPALGSAAEQEDADLAAAIAASMTVEPQGTQTSDDAAHVDATDTAVPAASLHPQLAQLVGKPCEGLIAQFCDPASLSPSLGVWQALLRLGGVYGAFGCHPHHAKYYSESWEQRMRKALLHPKAVALGECGLDYHRSASLHDVQQRVFAQQLTMAVELHKPIVVHCRNAEQDTLRILQECLPQDWRVHLHCYTGNATNAAKFAAAFPNLYFGFTGFVTQSHSDAAHTRAAISDVVPLERVLFETDGPWMCPRAAGANADVVAPVLRALYDAGRYRSASKPALPGAPDAASTAQPKGPKGRRRAQGTGSGNQTSVGCGKGGRTCHPGCIPAIAAVIAAEKGVSVAEAMTQVRKNTAAMYGV